MDEKLEFSEKADPAKKPLKKMYVKPAFRHERVFETSALACGKIQMGSTCKQQKKNS
jgi:hypothetical protein